MGTEKITISNDFHRTTVNIRLQPGGVLTDSQVRRVKSTLCGVPGCCCPTYSSVDNDPLMVVEETCSRLGKTGLQVYWVEEDLYWIEEVS